MNATIVEAPTAPLVMRFKISADEKTYEGNFTVPDNDGTGTLPMMVRCIVKLLAEDHPSFHGAKRVMIEANLE